MNRSSDCPTLASRSLLTLGVVVASFCVGYASPAVAQRISGVVVESASGEPVVEAVVTVIGEGSRRVDALTDSAGAFAMPLPRAGEYSLRVDRLGYESIETETFEVATGELLELRIVVGIQAVSLAPVEVVTRSRRGSRFHTDFYRRVEWGRQTGFGRYLTRADIEEFPAARTSSLLMRMPFVPLTYGSNGDVHVGRSRRGGNCGSAVFLNGMQVSTPGGIDWLVGPDELEGVEFYRSETEIPVELKRPGVCTVVSFWTRVGEANRAFSWRRLLVGGALLTGIVTLMVVR